MYIVDLWSTVSSHRVSAMVTLSFILMGVLSTVPNALAMWAVSGY